MKKTYLQPTVSVNITNLTNCILQDSLKVDSNKTITNEEDGGWVKESTEWDIWGNSED